MQGDTAYRLFSNLKPPHNFQCDFCVLFFFFFSALCVFVVNGVQCTRSRLLLTKMLKNICKLWAVSGEKSTGECFFLTGERSLRAWKTKIQWKNQGNVFVRESELLNTVECLVPTNINRPKCAFQFHYISCTQCRSFSHFFSGIKRNEYLYFAKKMLSFYTLSTLFTMYIYCMFIWWRSTYEWNVKWQDDKPNSNEKL